MASTDPQARRCPKCNAALDRREVRCWLCDFPFCTREELQKRIASANALTGFQFSLESLFLIIMLAATCLGILATLPPLGIVVTLFAVVATIRSIVECHRRRRAGESVTLGLKFESFYGSCAVIILALAASFIVGAAFALMTSCLVGAVYFLDVDVTGGHLVMTVSITSVSVTVAAAAYAFFFVYWYSLPPRSVIAAPSALRSTEY